MIPAERRVLDDPAALARAAAELALARAREACSERGRFDLVLSGGSTPERLYRELARAPRATFERWHLWQGDERFVPRDQPDSNYRMVRAALLDPLGWPPERVHAIPIAGLTPAEAARVYEREITVRLGRAAPLFDLVLLGLGADGHTASLFPGSPALDAHTLVASARPPLAPHERVTLTLHALGAARAVVFLVAGAEKRATLARLLALERPTRELPASLVSPLHGTVTWLLDRAAAPVKA